MVADVCPAYEKHSHQNHLQQPAPLLPQVQHTDHRGRLLSGFSVSSFLWPLHKARETFFFKLQIRSCQYYLKTLWGQLNLFRIKLESDMALFEPCLRSSCLYLCHFPLFPVYFFLFMSTFVWYEKHVSVYICMYVFVHV